MYDYNNKDKTVKEGLNDWYSSLHSDKDRTHTHKESRVTQTLKEIWERIKPTHSTKGNSKYHK